MEKDINDRTKTKDYTIDPETGVINYFPTAVRVLMRLSEPAINKFFKMAAEQENDPELKRLYRRFNEVRSGLAKYIRENNMKR